MIVKPDFLSHWKTNLLCELLDDRGAPLFLVHLWSHCEKQHAWRFGDMPALRLKAICRASGPADVFEKALVDAGFVARDGDVLVVLKWDEYNAGLIASWTNGSLGGRPPKRGKPKPADNPLETHGLPTDNPAATDGEPIKILTLIEANTPLSPLEGGVSSATDASHRKPKIRKRSAGTVTLAEFLARCKAEGEKAIPEDDPVFETAVKAGIPDAFVDLEWQWFRSQYAANSKRYADWRATFRNAVKGAWGGLWRINADGSCVLTTAGEQLRRICEAEAA